MKLPRPDPYVSAAILLMAAAAILLSAAFLTSLGEFVTAAFVVSATACFLIGIFMLTFARGRAVDPRVVGTLFSQWCLNIGRIGSDLGITGNAFFLPGRVSGESRVMQFNPSLTYSGSAVPGKEIFIRTGAGGLILTPSCDPWIRDLRERHALVIPERQEDLIILINETLGEVLEFASHVSGTWQEHSLTLTIHDYLFIDGCRAVARESEDLCAMNPCPVCSLCGCLIAEGTDKVASLDRCAASPRGRDVTVSFTLLPPRKGDTPPA